MGTFTGLVKGQRTFAPSGGSRVWELTVSSSAKGSASEMSSAWRMSRRKCSRRDPYALLESSRGLSHVDWSRLPNSRNAYFKFSDRPCGVSSSYEPSNTLIVGLCCKGHFAHCP